MNNADAPATPVQFDYPDNNNTRQIEIFRGLTKREHFAGMAMQGLLASEGCNWDVAKRAKEMADILLEELEK